MSWVWIGAGAALAVAFIALLMAPNASATDYYGDWTVSGSESVSYDTVYIWDGNLIIKAGGSLTLDSTTVMFCNYNDGGYGIDVAAKGSLTVQNGCTITSWDTYYHYYFKVSGSMSIDSSYISEVWGDSNSWKGGIQIYNSAVTISNSEIYGGRTGGISIFNCSPEITDNQIYDNGEDGGSAYYAFGIYGTNTHGNITGNHVYANQFIVPDVIDYGTWYPDAYGYGDDYYNGHYYWMDWWYTYYVYGYYIYYRYGYIDRADISTYSGKGVYIEGGSTSVISGNSIEQNGWAQFEGGWSYSGEIWEDSYHYYYYYGYTYTIPSCAGIGLYSGNSSLTIDNNFIDRNGYEPSVEVYTNWNNYPYKSYWTVASGVAVSLANSFGDITNNTISMGAILIDNYRSSPNITGNTMTSDYGVDPNNQWRGNAVWIPGRIGYTIRNYECSPYIANNTIKALSQDYGWYDYNTGSEFYNIDMYVVIENIKCPNVRILNNKITMQTANYGHVVAVGINATLKSTNMTVWGNTIEYKWSAQWSTGTITQTPMKLVQAAMLTDIDLQNNTFKGPAAGGGGGDMPKSVGAQAIFGSTLTVANNKFTGLDAFVFRDFSTGTISLTTIATAPNYCVQALNGANVVIRDSTVGGTRRGIAATKAFVEVYDSVMSSAQEFTLDKAATVNIYNTKHTKGAVQLLDMDSFFNVSWSVRLAVQWQNDQPVDGASVSIKDMVSAVVFTGRTDATGKPAESIWIKEFTGHNQVVTKLTPHRIYVSKARIDAMELFMIDGPINITFRLTDTVPPDLRVEQPIDGQHFNYSMVTISGTASDPESGLLNNAVILNIDNKGFVPVEVVDGRWSYTKPLGDGVHIVRIQASDIVDNMVRETLSFTVDTSAPGLQIFTPIDGSATNQRTITVTGISEPGAILTVNGLPAELEGRLFNKAISLETGPNLITVSASDAAGNTRTVLVHVSLDLTPPLLDIKEPRAGSSVNLNPISVLGNTEPGAIVKVNGAKVVLVESSFESLVDLSEGVNTISVSATDAAGNVNSVTFPLYLDTVLPDVNLFTPRDELWTNQSRVLVSGATEAGTVVTINGQNVNVLNTMFSNYVQLLEGPNKITVAAKDAAGNRRTVERRVYLDTRAPELVVSSPADGAALDTRVVPVFGSVDWGIEVYVNGELVLVRDFVFTTAVLARQDGPLAVEVVARDQAGNTAVIVRNVRVDTAAPVVTVTYPEDGLRVKQRIITVTGQTEPYSTVIINTETMLSVGRDGLFSMPVALEDGENRITITATDAAGNMGTAAKVIYKPKPAPADTTDWSWALNLTGLLIGIGIGLPVAAYVITTSWSRRRQGVLAEVEAAESDRRQKEAEQARLAAMPTVERMGKKPKAPPPEPEQKAPAAPEPMPEAPKAETAEPAEAKTGLKDKSGATEVSPDEIDQNTRMESKSAPEAPKAPEPPAAADSSLKDKGGEAEGEAGDTELHSRK
jgi:hypothetical protein